MRRVRDEKKEKRTRFSPVFGVFFLLLFCAGTGQAQWRWVTLDGGHLLGKRANDGDSFHVAVGGTEFIFRLYLVDAPETTLEFRERLQEQANYFGISLEQAMQVGEAAKRFTREKLSDRFLVRTSWEDALGRSRLERFYAFVQTRTGDLGEQLVANGLARVYAAGGKPQGLPAAAGEWQKLVALEQRAREEQIGAWGLRAGRTLFGATDGQSGKPVERLGGASASEPIVEIATAHSPPAEGPDDAAAVPNEKQIFSGPKLNVNTASQAELENVPGIGPVLARRIVAARPFKRIEELRKVRGIGDAKYSEIRGFFE